VNLNVSPACILKYEYSIPIVHVVPARSAVTGNDKDDDDNKFIPGLSYV